MNKRNAAHYPDPTAYEALTAIVREEKRKYNGGKRPRKNKKIKRCEYAKKQKIYN